MKKYIDLHVHTTASDGTMTPARLIRHASELNLGAIAITDHDTIAGIDEAMAEGEKLNIEVVPGIEISVDYTKEMHILGYYINTKSPELNSVLERLKQYRSERNPCILEKLNNIGLKISMDEVRQKSGGELVGRVHIAQVMKDKGYVDSAQEAFDKYLGFNKIAYVKRKKLLPEKGIQLIKKSGGFAVLAHPHYLSTDYKKIEDVLIKLKGLGLDGVEAYYTDYTPDMHEKYKNMAYKYGLLITGGSDFHGGNKPDIILGKGFGNLRVPYDILKRMKDIR